MSIPHLIRDSTPADEGFILRTWKMQLLDTEPLRSIDAHVNRVARSDERRSEGEPVPRNAVLASLNLLLDQTLAESRCRVACAPDNPDTILAFVIGRPEPRRSGALHCVYTKSVYRRMGLATTLLLDTGIDQCRAATMWSRFAETYGPRHGYTYEPSRLWGKQ